MKNQIKVIVDKRTELMGVLLLLSDKYSNKYPQLTKRNINKEYYEKIQEFASKIKGHRLLELIDYFTDNFNFGYNAPFDIINNVSEDLTAFKLNTNSGTYSKRLQKSPLVLEFLNQIPEFAEKYFNEFYDSNIEFYNYYICLAKSHISDFEDLPDYIHKFYGIDNSDKLYIYNLVFANGDGGGFGYEINNEVWCTHLIGFEDEKCYFNGGTFFLHEFSHPIINPLTDKYLKETFPIKDKEVLLNSGYSGLKTVINESVIRASTLIYVKNLNKEFYDKRLNREKEEGFIYIEDFIRLLEEYAAHRNKYKTIEDYYPTLIKTATEFLTKERL